jgi:hypothetical protein
MKIKVIQVIKTLIFSIWKIQISITTIILIILKLKWMNKVIMLLIDVVSDKKPSKVMK